MLPIGSYCSDISRCTVNKALKLKVWLVTAENLPEILSFFLNHLLSLIGKLILLESDLLLCLLSHTVSLETSVLFFQFCMLYFVNATLINLILYVFQLFVFVRLSCFSCGIYWET